MEVVVGGGEKLYSQNLRDFLRVKEDDHRNLNQSSPSGSGGDHRSSAGLTLSAFLTEKRGNPPPADEPPLQRIQSNRTLLDIIREDRTSGFGHDRGDGRRSWRHLRDKIRLRRKGAAAAWSSAVPIPSSDVPLNNRITFTTRHPSNRFNSGESTQPNVRAPSPHRNSSRSAERVSGRFELMPSPSPTSPMISEENRQGNEERGGDADEREVEGSPEQPARTSLMALLAENDRQMGFENSAYTMDNDENEESVADVATAAASGLEYNNCCVCMVRHKGAAFIPCGHTFCRLCSRELWVQRGNCPLCNNYIVEILDIF